MNSNWTSMFLQNPKILVADDDTVLAKAVARMLSQAGASVLAVHDGNSALVATGNFDPDLILCDVQMPHLRGDKVLAALRAAGFAKPFILLTGTDDRDILISTLRNQAFDYLLKPFCQDAVVASVQNALRQESQRLLRSEEIRCLHDSLTSTPPPADSASWQQWAEVAARQRVARRRQKVG